jgi:hypothetical protein
MPAQVIPLDSSPNQTWQASVNINGAVLTFFVTVSYNEIAEYWVMAISDANQNLLLSDVPLVAGLNLLRQYQYLGIGSIYLINVSGSDEDSPGENDLGSAWQLVWSDNTVVSVAS